jgi:hypothetical protein
MLCLSGFRLRDDRPDQRSHRHTIPTVQRTNRGRPENIGLVVEGNLRTDANTQNPRSHTLREGRDKRLAFAGGLQAELQSPGVLTRMAHLPVSDEDTE